MLSPVLDRAVEFLPNPFYPENVLKIKYFFALYLIFTTWYG